MPAEPSEPSASGHVARPRRWRSRRRIGIVLLVIITTGVLVTSLSFSVGSPIRRAWTDFAGGSYCEPNTQSASPVSAGRVALIDQLASKYPNPDFVERMIFFANETGRGFDYYPPETVTFDLMIDLPNRGYSMIILRTHGSATYGGDLSTIAVSEAYSQYRRIGDQMRDRVTAIEYNGTVYFALTSGFVTHLMCGRFSETLVLAMGCSTGTGVLADAFLEKGASAFVGWDTQVLLDWTDMTFEFLVSLLSEGRALGESVRTVREAFGPAPVSGAHLVYYEKAGNS